MERDRLSVEPDPRAVCSAVAAPVAEALLAAPSGQAWHLLERRSRLAMGEAAGRLARHEARAGSLVVCPAGSGGPPVMVVGAFVGLAQPAVGRTPAMAYQLRQAIGGPAAEGWAAMLPVDRQASPAFARTPATACQPRRAIGGPAAEGWTALLPAGSRARRAR